MNTLMYEHPLTAAHLKIVTDTLRYRVEGPIGKGLACGDIGLGAMTEWRDIVKMVAEEYHLHERTNLVQLGTMEWVYQKA